MGDFIFVAVPNPVSILTLLLIQFTFPVSAFSVPLPDITVSTSSRGFVGVFAQDRGVYLLHGHAYNF